MKIIAIVLFLTAVTACSISPAMRVSDAEGVESVSAMGMSCEKPFNLTQDCSGWSGSTKKISIGGQSLKVAGNADGTVTVLMTKASSTATAATNIAYELVKRELVAKGFKIVKVTPIESAGTMFGYAVETTEPNYHIWEDYAVE